jgi:hypothetical protein
VVRNLVGRHTIAPAPAFASLSWYRITHGSVTDFVLVNLGVWPFDQWLVFNVTDAVLVAAWRC